jgi:polyisoprenoid-binding protein YceI
MKSVLSVLLGLGLVLPALASGGAAARVLQIDPAQSRIDISVQATVDSFTGHLEHCAPEITLGEDGSIVSVRVPFHFRDVATGKAKRDTAMHEWQQTDRFPDGEFVLTALAPLQPGRFTARGNLLFHGVKHELVFPVAVTTDHALYAIDGEAILDTREYGLPIIKMFAVLKVDPHVKVAFHLQGRVP